MTRALIALVLMAGMAACAPTPHVPPPNAIELAEAERGVVISVSQVDSELSNTLADDGTGARIGGYAGLIIGSFFGQSEGRAVGALIGLGVGALTGAIIENEAERVTNTEYLIQLDTGEQIFALTPGGAR
ncbi:MAG: glycine zipper domain-containing protein, partial [Pseudomonadota bacterium]